MQVFSVLNAVISVLFLLFFAYQFFYMAVALVRRPPHFEKGDCNRFAVLIAARNEETVIGNLIDSIRAQAYDPHLVDIYVVADNCTDDTARLAAEHGAVVFQRFSEQRGKGYALDFLLQEIRKRHGFDLYDGYFVFDADNLLEPHFIEKMNKVFSAGYRIVTGYRNSKNYGSNWITAGCGLWFLHEARYLNRPRMLLHTSCTVNGTGFLMHREIVKKFDGWPQHLLVEDIQFSAENILAGEIIGYCEDAVFYDEQPEDFSVSWTQRLRWVRGHLQVVARYGPALVRGMFGPNFTSCYDFLMNIFPAAFLTVMMFLSGVGRVLCALVLHTGVLSAFLSLFSVLGGCYGMFLFLGTVTTLSEWKRIPAAPLQKIGFMFTFPIFMLTYIPISVISVFRRNMEWKPIRHTAAIRLCDIPTEKTEEKKK